MRLASPARLDHMHLFYPGRIAENGYLSATWCMTKRVPLHALHAITNNFSMLIKSIQFGTELALLESSHVELVNTGTQGGSS